MRTVQLLRAEARRSSGGRRRTVAPACTRFPHTRLTGRPPAKAGPTRTRAGLPFVLAPVTVSLTAVVTTSAGWSATAVLLACALVAVVGGVLAHRAVGRLVSGSMLAVARPFAPGDRLRLYVPELGRVAEAELVRVGPLTATLCTDSGVLVVPTGDLLRLPPA